MEMIARNATPSNTSAAARIRLSNFIWKYYSMPA
jgi:hypothetical protein